MSDNKTVLISSLNETNSLTSFTPKVSSVRKESVKQSPRASLFQQDLKSNGVSNDNPYLSLAKPLFRQIDILLHTYEVKDITEIHTLLRKLCDDFVEECAYLKLDNSQVMIVRYLVCTFMDELICTTYWGKEHNWAHESLLNFYYQETYGGEKFFQLLTKMLPTPASNIHILECMYVCIALGFEGKYRIHAKGKMELDAIRDNLFKQIKSYHGRSAIPFYSEAKASTQSHHFFYKVPYVKLGLASFASILIAYLFLSFPLISNENKTIALIDNALQQNMTHGVKE